MEWGHNEFHKGSHRIDMNLPWSSLLKELYRIPYSSGLTAYGQMYEYGTAMTWVVFPLALVGGVILVLVLLRGLTGALLGRSTWRPEPGTWTLLGVTLTLGAIVKFSPALWSARYQIAGAGLASTIVAWWCGRSRRRSFGGNVAGAVTVLAIISFFWTTPRSWLRLSEALRFLRVPYPEREVTPAREIGPELPLWNGSAVTREVGLMREQELGPGAVLVFSEDYGSYMSLFWNNRFSNRVVYVPQTADFARAAHELDATWVYCSSADATCQARVSAPRSGWSRIGPLDVENRGIVYRRSP